MKIFAKRDWDFDPTEWPVISFRNAGDRDNLLRAVEVGDQIVTIGTLTEQTPNAKRGRLLGIAEIVRTAVNTESVVRFEVSDTRLFDEEGRFRWPHSILITKARRFNPQPFLQEVLEDQLRRDATVRAVQLSEKDAAAVLSLPYVDIEIPRTRIRDRSDVSPRRPTTGPVPSTWQGSAGRDINRAAYTYVCRFGQHRIWKVGHAVDLDARLKELNKHIPPEIIPTPWSYLFNQKWPSEKAAYDMEQRVLRSPQLQRTCGEMVRCDEEVMRVAWFSAVQKGKKPV